MLRFRSERDIAVVDVAAATTTAAAALGITTATTRATCKKRK
jgi:hypothetical protein